MTNILTGYDGSCRVYNCLRQALFAAIRSDGSAYGYCGTHWKERVDNGSGYWKPYPWNVTPVDPESEAWDD